MSEAEVIQESHNGPVTQDSLSRDLTDLGITPGMVLLVHSSLSSLGWVCGGAVTVILALESVLRPYGTLVMPTHSGDLSDPSGWRAPPVPESWWDQIRQTMPAFDPDLTPTRRVGVIPEAFRKQPDVIRSNHPQVSFAAWGADAFAVVQDHGLEFSLGEKSPLARLYDRESWILLLGVGHQRNTAMHLAEIRAKYPKKQETLCGSPVLVDGHRRWKQYRDLDYDESDFPAIGRDYSRDHHAVFKTGTVGYAKADLIPFQLLVDYSAHWMERKRK